MTSTLNRKILLATLVVSVLASLLTGWLVQRQTLDVIREEAEADVRAVDVIHDDIRLFGTIVDDWQSLSVVVDELSTKSGRRIAVESTDGTILFDSDAGAPLPNRSTLIDPETFDQNEPLPPTNFQLLSDQTIFDIVDAIWMEELTPCLRELGVLEEPSIAMFDEPETEQEMFECSQQFEASFAPEDGFATLPVSPPVQLSIGYPNDTFAGLGSIEPQRIVAIVAIVAILAAAASAMLSNRIGTPLRTLTAAARRLGTGDLASRADVAGNDEIGALAAAFNSMADDIEHGELARQHMVRDVAHELRNPVGVLQGNIEAAQDGLFTLDTDLLDLLHDETLHLAALVEDLQQLALVDAGSLSITTEPTDLFALVDHVVSLHRVQATEADVTLTVNGSPVIADIDPTRIRQVVTNLVANAIQYNHAPGTVTVTVGDAGPQHVAVSVTDDGPGLRPEQAAHVFDRFWRADASRNRHTGGAGLGLSISKQLVEAHGGALSVETTWGTGCCFTAVLPTASSLPAGASLPAASSPSTP